MPTTREIASLAGVSVSTVSLVRNNRGNVAADTRQRVLEAIRQLEEAEERSHKGIVDEIAGGQTGMSVLALHSPVVGNTDYFRDLLQGIEAGVDQYNLKLRVAPSDPTTLENHITQLYFSDSTLQPDGVIFIHSLTWPWVVERTRELGVALVIVGSPIEDKSVSAVYSNEIRAGYEAAHHLLDMGHQKIAFICNVNALYIQQRAEGYRMALKERGIVPQDDWLILTESSETEQAVQRSIELIPEVTAILYGQHHTAYRALPVLADAGYRIPDDISIMTFDETEMARSYTPPLTTIAYPLFKEGYYAVKTLVELISDVEIEHRHTQMLTRIIARDSVRDLNKD